MTTLLEPVWFPVIAAVLIPARLPVLLLIEPPACLRMLWGDPDLKFSIFIF